MVFVPRFLRPSSFLPAALLLMLTGLLAGTGCQDNHIGRLCEVEPGKNPQPTASTVNEINSAALECPSRICLLPAAARGPTTTGPTCTAECDSDSDCEDSESRNSADPNDRRCTKGFACRVVTNLAGYACRKLCVCSDFFNPTENGACIPPK